MKHNNPKEDVTLDWENPFRPEDFQEDPMENYYQYAVHKFTAAEQANAHFRELIKAHGRMVYANRHSCQTKQCGHLHADWRDCQESVRGATHTAILLCEKEISGE